MKYKEAHNGLIECDYDIDNLPDGWCNCYKCEKLFEWSTYYEHTDTCPHCLWNHFTECYDTQQEWTISKEGN